MVRLLLAEDDALIGYELNDELHDAGYDVAGPFTTCAAAMTWLKSHSPTIALIDNILRDGSCTELARELNRRGIPIVVYSGRRQFQAPPEFKQAIWVEKPAAFATVLDAIRTAQTVLAINSENFSAHE